MTCGRGGGERSGARRSVRVHCMEGGSSRIRPMACVGRGWGTKGSLQAGYQWQLGKLVPIAAWQLRASSSMPRQHSPSKHLHTHAAHLAVHQYAEGIRRLLQRKSVAGLWRGQ